MTQQFLLLRFLLHGPFCDFIEERRHCVIECVLEFTGLGNPELLFFALKYYREGIKKNDETLFLFHQRRKAIVLGDQR